MASAKPPRPPKPVSSRTPARGPDPLIGTILADRYRIVERLGAGAMGIVYLGEHLKIGRRDAIKLLTSATAGQPESMSRFTRGARNLAQIRHPNVCTVYDFGETQDGVQFLAIEYVPGGSLSDLVARTGPLRTRRAVRLAIQIAQGLQAAHDQGIVHRDLKPDNVMVMQDRDGRDLAKVVDFDIAKGEEEVQGPEVTRMGHVVGTPQYMSPEQLAGDHLDGRSDVYSLAVLLFWMLTGRIPFDGESAHELMVQRLTVDAKSLAEVAPDRFPSELDRLLRRTLSRNPDDRPPSAEAFAQTLEALLPSPAAGPSAPSPEHADRTQVMDLPPSRSGSAPGEPLSQQPKGAPEPLVHPTTLAPGPLRARDRVASRGRRVVHASGVLALVLAGSLWFLARGPRAGSSTLESAAPASTDPGLASEGSESVDTLGVGLRAAARDLPTTELAADAGGAEGSSGGAGGTPDSSSAGRPTDGPDESVTARTRREPQPENPDPTPASPSPGAVLESLKAWAVELAPQTTGPGRATALRDRAAGYWRTETMDRQVRHWAAYVAGLAELNRGDPGAALLWIDRALALDPENRSYLAVRSALAGSGRQR